MASYTDAISQFNPYVQQLPVDLMMKVGMQKQAQYDQGVQKIQSYIDNVAGLETARPQDKEYLESKLGELGGKLRTVAAGDFSNQQLVNSVTGMTGQIIKDPYIQSAVYSSAKIKKNAKEMEEARKKGELAPENVDDYNIQLNKYMNGELGDRFDGQYIPYRDVFKKLKEIGDSVGIDGTKIEELFETDENGKKIPEYAKDAKGNFLLDSSGQKIFKGYKWNPIATTEALKGKDAAKILAAFDAALTPADYQQMAMTGRWRYKNKTPEQLAYESEHVYDDKLKDLDAAIEQQKIYLTIAEGATTPNQEDIQKHASFYNSLSKQRDMVAKNAQKAAESALSDPDQARANLYTSTYLSGISLAMASQDREIDKDVNPLFTVFDANRKYDMQLAENQASNYWKKLNYLQAERQLKISERNANREDFIAQMKYGIGADGKPVGLPDEIDLDAEGAPEELVSQVNKSYSNLVAQTDNYAYQLTAKFVKGIEGNENLTPAQVNEKIANMLKANKTPMIPGESNKTLTRIAGYVLAKYNKDKNSIPPQTASLVNKYINSLEQTTYARASMQGIDAEATKIAKEEGIDVASIKDVEKRIKPLTISVNPIDRSVGLSAKYEGARNVTLDKSDVQKLAMIAQVKSSLASTEEDKIQARVAQQQLNLKYGDKITNAIFERVFTKAGAIGPVAEIANMYGDLHNAKLTKIKAKLYKDASYVTQGSRLPLYTDESNKAVVGDKLSAILNKYKGTLTEADRDALVKGVTEGKFKANLDTRGVGLGGDTVHYLEVNDKVIPINAQDYIFLSNMAPPENRGVPPFVRYIDRVGTSNLTGIENPNAGNLFKDADFTNYKSNRYTLTGDFVRDDDPNTNLYWLKIYKHDKLGKERTKVIPYPRPISRVDNNDAINPQLRSIASGINNNVLEQIEK